MPATATRPTTALALPILTDVAAQPLLAQAIRLQEALAFLGSSLSEGDAKRLKALQQNVPNQETVGQIQALLDPYCLAMVTINPQARVTVQRGPAPARLIQGGWKSFLVKVENQAHSTAALQAESPNAQFPFQRYEWNPNDQKEKTITAG